jgi:hypothetical protein
MSSVFTGLNKAIDVFLSHVYDITIDPAILIKQNPISQTV